MEREKSQNVFKVNHPNEHLTKNFGKHLIRKIYELLLLKLPGTPDIPRKYYLGPYSGFNFGINSYNNFLYFIFDVEKMIGWRLVKVTKFFNKLFVIH